LTEDRAEATTEPELLAVLRSSRFAPGTNIRGERAGAPWTFLLPSLELGRVLLVGRPDAATEATVRRLAERVDVVATAERAPLAAYDLVAAVSDRVPDAAAFVASAAPRVAPGGSLFVLAPHHHAEEALARGAAEGLEIVLRGETRPARGELVAALSGGPPSIAPLVDRLGLVPPRASIAVSVRSWVPHRVAPLVRRAVRFRHRLTAATRERIVAAEPRQALVLRRLVTVSAARALGSDPLPAWLLELAAAAGHDLTGHPWAFVARGDYDSQKPIVVIADRTSTDPEIIVKVTRNPVWNARLENERRALDRLASVDHGWDRMTVPRVLFGGTHAGLAVVAETALTGGSFERAARDAAGDELFGAAVDAFIELGVATRRDATGAAHAAAIAPLVDRFASIWPLADRERSALDGDLDTLARIERLPAVMVHGDAGTWNLIRTPSGRVGALDWEAAEVAGPPLWDVERLAEAWAMLDRSSGPRSATDRAIGHLVDGSPLTPTLGNAVRRSAAALAVPDDAIAPLVRLAWVARALKEANRLRPSELSTGRHQRLVRRTIAGNREGWRILTGRA
jgi:hypothetical protein